MSQDESPDQAGGVADGNDAEGAATETLGVDELIAALETSKAAAAQLRDQVLRAQAETENVRRRAQRDVENAHKFAIEKFAAELIPVADSLERAVETARANRADGAAAAIGANSRVESRIVSWNIFKSMSFPVLNADSIPSRAGPCNSSSASAVV